MMNFEIVDISSLGDEDFNIAFENLSQSKKERCLKFKFSEDRRRLAFGDMLLRDLLKRIYMVSSDSVTVDNLPSGKPVANVNGKDVCVSLSHSGSFVAAAVSDSAVGIDIECRKSVKRSLVKSIFDAAEQSFVLDENAQDELLDNAERQRFLRLWTAKEAYVKLTGEGLKGLGKADVLPLIKNDENSDLTFKSVCKSEYVCTVISKSG